MVGKVVRVGHLIHELRLVGLILVTRAVVHLLLHGYTLVLADRSPLKLSSSHQIAPLGVPPLGMRWLEHYIVRLSANSIK